LGQYFDLERKKLKQMKNLLKPGGFILPIAFLCLPLILLGQVQQLNNFYGQSHAGGDICVKSGNFDTDVSVERLVTQILEKYGAKNRYVIVPCDRTSTAQATVDDKMRPYILYNPQFINSLKPLNFTTSTVGGVGSTNWEKLAILSHEIGHHINYHIINPHPDATNRSMELEADETAGHILYKLGATLEDAQRVMYSSAVSAEGSYTHPPRAQRLAAIEKGWRQAERQFPRTTEGPKPANEETDADLRHFNMVRVRGGTFMMGCTGEQGSDCQESEKPVHQVTVSDFYIGKYEVTVNEFKVFVESTGYRTDAEKDGGSYFWTGSTWEKRSGVNWRFRGDGTQRSTNEGNHPVLHVSWNDAVEYCKWLSKRSGKGYRLPTEAEWEYAARGGTSSRGYKYAGSNNVDEVAWYGSNSGRKTQPVGQKNANELGLYDMSGNVWEWCADDWLGNYIGAPPTGRAWIENPRASGRVYRGGSWIYVALFCRVSFRFYSGPSFRSYALGFRLAL
jgi:formylglycine-generating enzyme required for sulfatase activity